MIFAVDIENNSITIGCMEQERIFFIERLSSDMNKTAMEYAMEIKGVFDLYHLDYKKVKGIIISSVVPPLCDVIQNATKKLTDVRPIVVGPGVKTGLNICMDNPAQVGSDLVVNAVSANESYKAPLIIIDMRTATTIAIIDEKKNYIGGMILPGVKESLETLAKQTSQLPRISLSEPKRFVGKNTIESMKSGIVYGTASMLDGMIHRIQKELKEEATIIATGELANLIVPYCTSDIVLNELLGMKGLQLIYEKNVN